MFMPSLSRVSQAVTLTEDSYIVQMIHKCIALAVSLVYGPFFVRMDALGTHLVEKGIGKARAACNDPRWSRKDAMKTHEHGGAQA